MVSSRSLMGWSKLFLLSIAVSVLAEISAQTSPTISNVLATSFVISFEEVPDATRYYATLRERHSDTSLTYCLSGSGDTISSLTSSTIYDVSIKAENSSGAVGADSSTTEVHTLPGPPTIVTNGVSPDAISVFFGGRNYARVSQYTVQYGVDGAEKVTTVTTVPGEYYHHRLSGLLASTKYRIRAKAFQIYGTGNLTDTEYSDWQTFTTASLSVFGGVVLENIVYNAQHDNKSSTAFEEVQGIVKSAHSHLSGSGFVLETILLEIENASGKAQAYYELKVNDTSLPSPTNFTLSGSNYSNQVINNGGALTGFLTYYAVDNFNWEISYNKTYGTPSCAGEIKFSDVTFLEDGTNFPRDAVDDGAATLDGFSEVGINGDIVNSKTVTRNMVVVVTQTTLVQDCLSGTNTGVYSRYYKTVNKTNPSQELDLFIGTVEPDSTVWDQSDFFYRSSSDGTSLTVSVPAVEKAIKYELRNEDDTVVATLEEKELDGSDRWQLTVDSLTDKTLYAFKPRITFRSDNGTNILVDGDFITITTDRNQCELCNNDASCSSNNTNNCSCNDHYLGNGIHCEPRTYCLSSPCHTNATCSERNVTCENENTYICTCQSGLSGNGTTCFDIDECTKKTHNCDDNANCTNTDGSFMCNCTEGYTGSGTNCSDIDECTEETDNCDDNANCTNTDGSFICNCTEGYTGSGTNCSDIDECTEKTDNCDDNANCTNIKGSFTCNCTEGFSGSGTNCSDIDESNEATCTLKHIDVTEISIDCSNTSRNTNYVLVTTSNGHEASSVACNDISEEEKSFTVFVNGSVIVDEFLPGNTYLISTYHVENDIEVLLAEELVVIPPYETPIPQFVAGSDTITATWQKPYNGTEYLVTFNCEELDKEDNRTIRTTNPFVEFSGLEAGHRYQVCITLTFCQAQSPGLKPKCNTTFTLPGPITNVSFLFSQNAITIAWTNARGTSIVRIIVTPYIEGVNRRKKRATLVKEERDVTGNTWTNTQLQPRQRYSFSATPRNSAGEGETTYLQFTFPPGTTTGEPDVSGVISTPTPATEQSTVISTTAVPQHSTTADSISSSYTSLSATAASSQGRSTVSITETTDITKATTTNMVPSSPSSPTSTDTTSREDTSVVTLTTPEPPTTMGCPELCTPEKIQQYCPVTSCKKNETLSSTSRYSLSCECSVPGDPPCLARTCANEYCRDSPCVVSAECIDYTEGYHCTCKNGYVAEDLNCQRLLISLGILEIFLISAAAVVIVILLVAIAARYFRRATSEGNSKQTSQESRNSDSGNFTSESNDVWEETPTAQRSRV